MSLADPRPVEHVVGVAATLGLPAALELISDLEREEAREAAGSVLAAVHVLVGRLDGRQRREVLGRHDGADLVPWIELVCDHPPPETVELIVEAGVLAAVLRGCVVVLLDLSAARARLQPLDWPGWSVPPPSEIPPPEHTPT